MPAEGATVTIAVDDSSLWAAEGQLVYVEGWGYLEVTDVPSATTLTVENLAGYGNSTAGTLLVAGAKVSPAGLRSGTNAYTTSTTGLDVMPAEGGSVTVTTSSDTSFLAVGQIAYVQFWGWLRVLATPTTTSVTLENIEDAATDAYLENAAPGTLLPAGARIVPGGLQGPSGATPSGALLAANNLNDVDDPATSRSNLGLGTMAVQAAGSVAITGGSITGITDLAVADGGTGSSNASDARTALGLGTISTQAASAVAITGGDIRGTPIGIGTPSTGSFTTLASSGAATLNSVAVAGNASVGGGLFLPASATQSLVAANTINPNAAKVKVVGSGGAVTLTSTPSITAPLADGQLLLIQGTHATNTLTVQDEGTLPSSGLRLGAATRVLGLGDTLLLTWDAATSIFYEVAYTQQV